MSWLNLEGYSMYPCGWVAKEGMSRLSIHLQATNAHTETQNSAYYRKELTVDTWPDTTVTTLGGI